MHDLSGYWHDIIFAKFAPGMATHRTAQFSVCFPCRRVDECSGGESRRSFALHFFDLHSCRTVDLTGAEALLDGLRELRAAGIKVSLMNVPAEFEAASPGERASARQFVRRESPGGDASSLRASPLRTHRR